MHFGPFVLDTAQARLHLQDGPELALSGRPLELLAVLVAHAGELLDKDTLLDAVWGHRHVSESVLKGVVSTLRLALGDDPKAPRYIETVARRGYRFVAPVERWTPAADTVAADPAGSGPDEPPAPGNMPVAVELPIGRDAELALLHERMDSHRLVTITGLGGVGKTCLALAMAAQVAEPAGGRWLLRLDALAEPALLLPTLARLLHLGPAAASSTAALVRALADRQLLLVLDNAEHLADAVAELCTAVLAAAPEVQVLVTSQVPLRVTAEALLPLAPLSEAAPELLAQRIRRLQPQWQPTAAEQSDLDAICHALDGLPLALELAAARVPLLGVSGVRARLDQRFSLLTQGARDGTPRHRTLAAALAWTFDLLAQAERRALQQLAVFAGSFAVTDAEGVLGDDALDVLQELRARSLVAAEQGLQGQRMRLYDSVRRYALQDLASSGREVEVRSLHLAWLGRHLQDSWRSDLFEAQEHWLPRLGQDLDSLREALRFGLSEAAPAAARWLAIQLAADSSRVWHRQGLFAEGWAWLQAAQARRQAAGHHIDAAIAARLDLATAYFCAGTQQGEPRGALAWLQRALTWIDAQPDPLWRYLAGVAEYDLLLRLHPDRVAALDSAVARVQDQLQAAWPPLARRPLLRVQASDCRRHGDFAGVMQRMDEYRALCLAHAARESALVADLYRLQALALLGRWDEARDGAVELLQALYALDRTRDSLFHAATAAAILFRTGGWPHGQRLRNPCLRLLVDAGLLWWLADALPWAAWHDGRPEDALRLQAWADSLVAARGETRGPLFGGMRAQLLERLADRRQSTLPAPSSEAEALALALGDSDPLAPTSQGIAVSRR